MKEIWKPVKGYEKSHEVSNLGKIRTIDRILHIDRKNKKYFRRKEGQVLSNRIRQNGYCRIYMVRKTNKEMYIHRMVAMAFIPNPKNKPQVNHKNGIKTDNRVINLEWVTEKENMEHAKKNGFLTRKKYG